MRYRARRAFDETKAAFDLSREEPPAEARVVHVRRQVVNVEHRSASKQSWDKRSCDQEIGRRVNVDDVDWFLTVDPEHGQSCPRRESNILDDCAQDTCASQMPDWQPANPNLVDGLRCWLVGQAKANYVDVVTGLDRGLCLPLSPRLPNWIMRMDDHADVRTA
jgi:hypothetical protein